MQAGISGLEDSRYQLSFQKNERDRQHNRNQYGRHQNRLRVPHPFDEAQRRRTGGVTMIATQGARRGPSGHNNRSSRTHPLLCKGWATRPTRDLLVG